MASGAEEPPPQGLRLLSLDGGGIRGLSSLLILKQLMRSVNPDSPPKPCEVFNLIGGTSTGGLIAIMLGRLSMTVDECIRAYLQLCQAVFTPQRAHWNFFGRAHDAWNVHGAFDSAALASGVRGIVATQIARQSGDMMEVACTDGVNEQALSLYGGALMMDEGIRCKSFVCAIREEMRDTVSLFRSYSSPRALDLAPEIWEAARATSAATTFFEPIEIGPMGERFVDGALGFNNPVHVVLDEAIDCWTRARDNVHCIVSIGTGEVHSGPVGQTAPAVLKTLVAIAAESDRTAKRFEKDHPGYVQQGKYYRFNVNRGLEDVKLEEYKKINVIAAATARYMEGEDQFGKVCQFRDQITQRTMITPVAPPREVSVEQAQFLHRYSREVCLEYRASPVIDLSTCTVALPQRLFGFDVICYDFSLSKKPPFELKSYWSQILCAYRESENVDFQQDTRRTRMSLFEAPWYPGLGGLLLAHVPVSEIYRFITSTQSARQLRPGVNPYGVSVFLKGQHQDEPLFLLDSGEAAGGISHSSIVSEEFARCAVGRGWLAPSGVCGEKFHNQMPGLERIPMPWSLFFTDMSSVGIFFRQHTTVAFEMMKALLEILVTLWDHDDAIDLDDDQVPIKVRLEEGYAPLRHRRDLFIRTLAPAGHYKLRGACERYFAGANGQSFEVEDALGLIKDLSRPDASERNFDADHWVGHFGFEPARWICLALIINVIGNLDRCDILSSEYDCLLESSSGMCYVA